MNDNPWLSAILDELRTGNKVYGVVEAHKAIVAHMEAHTANAVLEARLEEVEGFEALDPLGTMQRMERTNDYLQRRKDALKQGPNHAK